MYKSIRVTEKAYNELVQRQLPRESFSEEIERLLGLLEDILGEIHSIDNKAKEGKPWNTNR